MGPPIWPPIPLEKRHEEFRRVVETQGTLRTPPGAIFVGISGTRTRIRRRRGIRTRIQGRSASRRLVAIMCPILPASPETPITAMDREWKNGSRVLTEGAFTPRVNVNHACDREQARVARRRRWLYGLRGRCSKTLQFRDLGICLSTNRLFSESLVRGQHFALHAGSHRGTTLCERGQI
jgi:hypothetical protein